MTDLVIAKRELSARQQQQLGEKRQAQVGLASNVVGLAAGTAGTAAAYNALQSERGKTRPPAQHRVARVARRVKGNHAVGLAAAGLGLQVANVGGDVVANRVLARSAKDPVGKADVLSEMVYESEVERIGHGTRLDPAPLSGVEKALNARQVGALGRQVENGNAHDPATRFARARLSQRKLQRTVGAADRGRRAGLAGDKALATTNFPRAMRAAETDFRRASVTKATRRFDPEADRQRRMGVAAGAGLGTGIVLTNSGVRRLSDLRDPAKGTVRVKNLSRRNKQGLLLAAGGLASAGGGVEAYRRGVSRRNQPWN